MKISHFLLATSIATNLTACSSFGIDGIFNSRTLEAEERMLLVTDKGVILNDDGTVKSENLRVVCAEPSPDAISALAFIGSLRGDLGTKGIEASGSLSQTLGELGERTPVVQLLRDSLFRACEAHMNGVIDKEDYQDILTFFDVYSTTLLGIESLTRQSRPPVTVSAGGSEISINADKSVKSTTAVPANSGTTILDNKHFDENTKQISNILQNYYIAKTNLFYLSELRKYRNNNKNAKTFFNHEHYFSAIDNYLTKMAQEANKQQQNLTKEDIIQVVQEVLKQQPMQTKPAVASPQKSNKKAVTGAKK